MRKPLPRWAVGVFFAAVLLLGLCTAADYGPTWDESDEMDILRMNLWEYARTLHLDESAFERRAAQGQGLSIQALMPISRSVERDHGIAAFYPLAPVVMSETLDGYARSALWHMGCWALFTLGAFALYASCRELGLPRGAALLGPLLLLCSPRFFAQGHYNNKDIALMALTLCMLWQALRLMRRPELGGGLCFAFFGALAANTKVAGLALWGLCAVFVLAESLLQKRMTRRVWAVAGGTLAAFALFTLLTPALWTDPAGFLRYLAQNAVDFQRWQNSVLFRGMVFQTEVQPLPWYYLPYMIVATTPLWLLGLMAAGAVWALLHARNRRMLLTLLLAALPLGFAVLTRTSVYNGWRHFYFVYGPMLALAAWAGWKLCTRFRRIFPVLLAAALIVSGVEIALEHPYQYAYYQPAVRLRGEGFLEGDYWNVSARGALETLADQTEGTFRVAGGDLWGENAVRKALAAMPDGLRQRFVHDPQGAEYVLVNPTYLLIGGAEPEGTLCVETRAYGQAIMQIYAAKGTQP